MKKLAILLTISILGLHMQAQVLEKTITLSPGRQTGRSLLSQIAQQQKLHFSFDETVGKKLELSITITDRTAPVKEILDRIDKEASLTYTLTNNYIIFKEAGDRKDAGARTVMTGKIMDPSGNPLSGATLRNYGTGASTSTDEQGAFSLAATIGDRIDISHIGYEAQTVRIRATSPMTIVLHQQTSAMQEVVVTALGITREKKRLGFAVQEVKGEDLNTARTTNMFDALQGKVAGMNMTQASTGVANSVRIVLRGESSLVLSKNQALIVVDGVPINNNAGTAGSTDLPVDYGSGGAEISPDDIESISVLKGPNAAALYGSRASGGVIVIKTKKAPASQKLGIAVNSSVVLDKVLKTPDFQNEYGGGTGVGLKYYSYGDGPDGPNTSNSGHNWGAPFQGQSFVQYGSPLDASGKRIASPWVPHPNNVRDFYVTGKTIDNSISLTKAGDFGNFRASYNNFNQSGIMPNTGLHRNQFNINTGINITPRMTFNANINYINTYSNNLPTVGYGVSSPTYNFIWFERNADIDWFKNYWVKGKEGIQQAYYFTWGDNPYLTMYEQLNSLRRNRIFGNAYVTYAITDNLTFMARTGVDYSGDVRISRRPFSSASALTGLYRREDYTYFERNSDFLLSYNHPLGRDFKLSASVGGNNLQINVYDNITTATGLVIPAVYNLGNASSRPAIAENNTVKIVNGLYALADLDYKGLLFLGITGRNDWSSTLPSSHNSYFYPSVSLSAMASDIFHLNRPWLNFWKLRASYATVGNDTDPYQTTAYYNYSTLPNNVTLPATLPNADLKPEKTTSLEAGTEVKLFHNRVSVDLTYYHTDSRNQILSSPLPTASGYTAKVMNAGKITNRGFEAIVQVTPVRGIFTWDITVTGSTNRSKVVQLAAGVNSYIMATAQNATIEARVGGRMGDIYGIGFQRSPQGKILYKNGTPVFTTNTIKIGNYNPDFIGGIRNSLRYKNVSLSFLLDGHIGGTIYSYTHSTGDEAGSLENTLVGRKDGIVGDGVVDAGNGTYTPNTVKVAAYTYYRGYYVRPNVEANSFKATYFKLREVIVGYKLPQSLLRKTPFQSVQFNLTGRNLLLFTKVPYIDPETAFVSNGGLIVPGIESAQIPSTRSFGMDLKLNF